MTLFSELETSLEEAVDIHQGKMQATRSTRYEVADVKAIRKQLLKVTQAEFAKTMGVSIDTVKSWESRRRNPAGLAAKVLAAIQADPAIYSALASQ
ncbi:NadS family protein [Alteromonas confluentis]|uniref:Transcriptional regulator n=1 Tax=Alteromonas confluentis TaxID=1656094 RepID=A0A1E7Z6W8_9ALTE|nr:NadS family protein [Alteromonas confluentis]OFC69134.1 transcriptional regulator [Alteromonas confluentis]